jgi:hypothetical protein
MSTMQVVTHQFGRNLDRHADPRLPAQIGGYLRGHTKSQVTLREE